MKHKQNHTNFKLAESLTRENTDQIVSNLVNGFADNHRKEQVNQNSKHQKNILKFPIHYSNKYFDHREQISRDKSRQSEGSRVSAIKIYEVSGHSEAKQIERLTFGPANLKTKQLQKNRNSELLMPITHKDQQKSKVSQSSSISPKKQKISQIITQQLGIRQQQVENMKEDALNYELQKFVKKKGLEYLQQNRQKLYRRANTEPLSQPKATPNPQQKTQRDYKRKKLQKYPNYIPEVFPKLKPSTSKSSISSEKQHRRLQSKLNDPPLVNKSKQSKIKHLNDREQMLGKIVYDKVQNYFNLDKKADYFERVKSQEMIDEAWLQYLRTKMDRADLMLHKK